MQPGTTTELNLADWFRANKIEFKPVVIDKVTGSCALNQAVATPSPTTLRSWPPCAPRRSPSRTTTRSCRRFSKEPLGPMVRQGDENWLGIVRWTLFALLEAEEYGITQKNVDEMLKTTIPTSRASWA